MQNTLTVLNDMDNGDRAEGIERVPCQHRHFIMAEPIVMEMIIWAALKSKQLSTIQLPLFET